MTSGGQFITYNAVASAAVVAADWKFEWAAPTIVMAALTTCLTAVFMYVYPFLKVLRDRAIGPVE